MDRLLMGYTISNERVSVLLPVYKEPLEWIKKSVNSILSQTYNHLEVIVLNDNPHREDVAIWLDSLNNGKVIYHVNESNVGLVANLNNGLKLCSGEYVARMDADDIALSDRIEKQIAFLLKNGCDIVGGNIECFGDHVLSRSNLPCTHEKLTKIIKSQRSIPHPTWLVKRCVYEQLGGYRTIPYTEDYDFLIRAILAGYKLGVVNDIILRYRQNKEGISQTNKGKQKFITKLLCEQAKKRKVFSEDYISKKINANSDIIKSYNKCYTYSRKMRNALISHDVTAILRLIMRLKINYITLLLEDYWCGIYVKLLKD